MQLKNKFTYLVFWILFLIRSRRELVKILISNNSPIHIKPANLIKALLGFRAPVELIVEGRQALVEVNNISDLTVLFEIYTQEIYPIEQTKQKITIVDLGSYVGYFAIFCLLKCPQAQIYCYEPDEDSFKKLMTNLRLNRKIAHQVKYSNFGLGKEREKRAFYHYKFSSHNSLFKFYNPSKTTIITLQPIKKELNKIKGKIDLLKIDVEGAEHEILSSLGKSEASKIKQILVEVHDLDKEINTKTLINYLSQFYNQLAVSNKILSASNYKKSK